MVPMIRIQTSTGIINVEVIKYNTLTYKVRAKNKDGDKYFKIRKRDSRIIHE